MGYVRIITTIFQIAASEAVSVGQLVSQLGQFKELIPKLKWVEDDGLSLKEAFPKMLETIWSQGLLVTTFVRQMDLLAQLQRDNGDAAESETLPELNVDRTPAQIRPLRSGTPHGDLQLRSKLLEGCGTPRQ